MVWGLLSPALLYSQCMLLAWLGVSVVMVMFVLAESVANKVRTYRYCKYSRLTQLRYNVLHKKVLKLL